MTSAPPGGVRARGPAHQQHSRSAPQRSFGQGVSHAAAGAVGEIAHRIDLFPRGSGRDQNGFAGQLLRSAQSFHRGRDNQVVLRQPAGAGHAASQIAVAGLDDPHAALAQDFQIRLRGRMVPHIHVHRGRDHDRRGGRQIKRGQEIAGNALRELGENVGRGGHNQQRINRLRDRDMLDGRVDVGLGIFVARGEHIGDDFFAGERGKGERANKLLRPLGHDDLHADAAVLQQANDFRRLVGRNPAADSECNFHELSVSSDELQIPD